MHNIRLLPKNQQRSRLANRVVVPNTPLTSFQGQLPGTCGMVESRSTGSFYTVPIYL